MSERYLTLLPPSSLLEEVEVELWFVSHGKRKAVVFRMHHGEPIHYVREEVHLMPLEETATAQP
jgi:hypothetical protein